jgi:DNA-binding CsgD family transcriptional regulator
MASMADLGQRAHTFAVTVRGMTAMEELSDAVLAAIGPFGLTAAASGMVSGPKAASLAPFHFANWPEEWVQLYLAEDFLLIDPVPRWSRSSGRAVAWSELCEILPARDPGRRVIEAGNKFGFTEGLLVPTRAADNSLGAVAFAGRRGRLSPDEQVFLETVARNTFFAADRISNEGALGKIAPILSRREIEVLALLVRGHRDKEIGAMIGLTVRAVRFHLTNAREKFAATSRTHLAAIVLANGYVGP